MASDKILTREEFYAEVYTVREFGMTFSPNMAANADSAWDKVMSHDAALRAEVERLRHVDRVTRMVTVREGEEVPLKEWLHRVVSGCIDDMSPEEWEEYRLGVLRELTHPRDEHPNTGHTS